MKRLLFVAVSIILSLCNISAQASEPSWLVEAPISSSDYIGIASAPLANSNYRDVAQLLALNNIAAQISVNVESNSFMESIDINGEVREIFASSIRESLSAHLSGYEIIDNYTSDSHYYIYIRLNKEIYSNYITAKRKEIIQLGLDYLIKGLTAEESGDLLLALSIYAKGLSEVEPYLNLSLDGLYDGSYINVATELYVAYKAIFSSLSLTSNVSQLSVESLTSMSEPIKVRLSKSGVAIPNISLSAEFSSGDGVLTTPVKTDSNGEATIYLTKVISKDASQSVVISIDQSVTRGLAKSYRDLISSNTFPSLRVMLEVAKSSHTAYFDIDNNDIKECEAGVRSILANNYFEVVEDLNSELYILYSTNLTAGAQIDGDIYKLNEYYCSLSLKIYDNASRTLRAEYNTTEIRLLVPENKSEAQASQMCARELMKRYKAGLPAVLKGF